MGWELSYLQIGKKYSFIISVFMIIVNMRLIVGVTISNLGFVLVKKLFISNLQDINKWNVITLI